VRRKNEREHLQRNILRIYVKLGRVSCHGWIDAVSLDAAETQQGCHAPTVLWPNRFLGSDDSTLAYAKDGFNAAKS